MKAHCRTIPFLCKLLGVPDTFYKGCEALELGSQITDEVGEGTAGIVGPPEATPPVPCIKTSTANRKRRVAVAGDSPLRGTEASMCRLNPACVEVCCLSRARKTDITGKLLSPVRISDYYLLLIVQVGSGKITKRSPRHTKRDFRALEWLVEGPGAQVVISLILPVTLSIIYMNRQIHQVNAQLQGWSHWKKFVFVDHGRVYSTPDLLIPDGTHSEGKKSSGMGVSGACWLNFKFAWKGERNKKQACQW